MREMMGAASNQSRAAAAAIAMDRAGGGNPLQLLETGVRGWVHPVTPK
jgi:hypothetical protein